jgi:hypothetical protein
MNLILSRTCIAEGCALQWRFDPVYVADTGPAWIKQMPVGYGCSRPALLDLRYSSERSCDARPVL